MLDTTPSSITSVIELAVPLTDELMRREYDAFHQSLPAPLDPRTIYRPEGTARLAP